MKRLFGGFITLCVVSWCVGAQAACSGGAKQTQTVRIVPGRSGGQDVMRKPQVVSNTITMGNPRSAPQVRVNTNGSANPRYVGGTPTLDVDVRMPDENMFIDEGSDYGVGLSGVQRYAPRQATQPGYAPTYRQPTVSQRANNPRPTNYYTGNGVETMNAQPAAAPVRYNDAGRGDYRQSQRVESQYSSNSNRTDAAPRAYSSNSNSRGYGYVGAHFDLNLLNWRNTYSALPVEAIYDIGADHDDYRFKPVIGGDLFLGYRFNPSWRADVEFGYVSNYKDSDNGITFELSVPYVTANIYHDFENGLYFGLGAGAAFPTVSMEWENFTANSSRKTGASFTGAAMLGYSYELSRFLFLDARYRISGFKGPSITRGVSHFGILESVTTSVGFVLDNAISVGLRYEF